MAKFKGFACDSCEAPTPNEDKTRKIIRFEGPTISGEYVQELCPNCTVAPADVTLKPLRRRKRQATPAGTAVPMANVLETLKP